jgi:hypothetical protein
VTAITNVHPVLTIWLRRAKVWLIIHGIKIHERMQIPPLVLAVASASVFASDVVPNSDVASAMKSLVDSERATYTKLITSRVSEHKCKLGDAAALKSNSALIPDVATFQTIVGLAFKADDGGKFAVGLDPALASKAGSMPAEQAADILHAYAAISRTAYTATVAARAP